MHDESKDRFDARGGITIAAVKTDDNRYIAGCAFCSIRDNYCRKTGRELALKRLVTGTPTMLVFDWDKDVPYSHNIANFISQVVYKTPPPANNWWKKNYPNTYWMGLIRQNVVFDLWGCDSVDESDLED